MLFHQVTMARRDALSVWLQQTVAVVAKRDLEAAKLSKNTTKVTLANLATPVNMVTTVSGHRSHKGRNSHFSHPGH